MIALELARYLRKYHKQFSDDPSNELDEELDAQRDPNFARYLKAVDGFVACKASASSLVSTLGQLLYPVAGKVTS